MEQTMNENGKAKVTVLAIFGMGRMGKVHFQNTIAKENVVVKYIVETAVGVAEQFLERYQLGEAIKILHLDEADVVYRDNSVDAVLVVTPAHTHEAIIRNSLQAGKAVFSEKPLATTLEAVTSLYSLAEKVQKHLFCAFNRRWDPQLRSIYKAIRKEELGDVRMIKSCSRDPVGHSSMEYYKTSGGVFLDSVIHDIDMVCWLSGQKPTSLICTAHAHEPQFKAIGDYDTVALMLNFPSGCVGMIDTSRCSSYGYDQRMEVHGPKGMLQSENLRCTGLLQWTGTGTTLDRIPTNCPVRYKESYRLELDHFVDLVIGNAEEEVTSFSTIMAVKIACACKLSAETGQPIYLEF